MDEIVIRVTSVSILDRPAADNGLRLVAAFDCDIGPVAFVGCAMLRTPKGGLTVSLPRLNEKGARRAATITDSSVRAKLLEAARTAYRAIGGTEAEWQPRTRDGAEDTAPRTPGKVEAA